MPEMHKKPPRQQKQLVQMQEFSPVDGSVLTNRQLKRSVSTDQVSNRCWTSSFIPLAGEDVCMHGHTQPPPTVQKSCWFAPVPCRLLGWPYNMQFLQTSRQTEKTKSTALPPQLIWNLSHSLLPKLKPVPWRFHTHITIISFPSLWKQVR